MLYDSEYSSYAGVDIVAQLVTPADGAITIGEVQSISYSIHREAYPVRALSHAAPIGFTKGSRTIAGSMVFTTFDSYFFYKLPSYQAAMNNGVFPLADQMPPFDISLSFANEYGSTAKMVIYGITILDEQGVLSIGDLITENVYTFMARGIIPMMTGDQDNARYQRYINSQAGLGFLGGLQS